MYALKYSHASKINALNLPRVVRNGTGPIDLSCVYDVRSDENGLVVKWYQNMDQVYQWIPPMLPQDVGVINGLAEYPEENLRQPNSRSVIRLRTVTVEMGGEYTCTISTFQEEDSKRSRMIVYAPEKDATIHVSSFNETHLNLTCVVNGAQPRPFLKFYVEGVEVHDYYDRTEKTEWYRKDLSVKVVIIRNTFEPMLLDCEVSIPQTEYKRRERIVYYPAQSLSQTSTLSRSHQQTSITTYTVITFPCILILLTTY
ncbi:PREDICTED: uncharacterized protein LOC107187147 [Dufourea novaeangliae]|uniref:uncharacterized protein LOC107187147 n=1 Tax=Dufourea novaeangliae TaxID=178035 RepID=UPI000767DA0E|nr:PREDICTED: uncharacterized protein LOC107187147 [Dufourea novaeangliae]